MALEETGSEACPYCAEPVEANAKRCPECGEYLRDRPQEVAPRRKPTGAVMALAAMDVALGLLPLITVPFALLSLPGGGATVVMSLGCLMVGALVLIGAGAGLYLLQSWARYLAIVLSIGASLLFTISIVGMVILFATQKSGMGMPLVPFVMTMAIYGGGLAFFVAQTGVLLREKIAAEFV